MSTLSNLLPPAARPYSLLKPSYPYYGPRFFAGQFDYGRWPRDWQQPDWRRYSDEWRNRGWGHHW